MLPTGHLAGGFLAAYSFIKIAKPDLDLSQINQLLAFGTFIGFVPDLDEFYAFAKNKSLLVASKTTPVHRQYFFHAPVLWVLGGLVVYFASSNYFIQNLAIVFILSALSHFILDSIEFGIMWLWPFKKKLYALKDAASNRPIIQEENFFKHSFKFVLVYSKRLSFYLEVLIFFTALVVLFK